MVRARVHARIWAAQLALIYHRTHLPPTTRFNMFYECITVSIEIFWPPRVRMDTRASGYKYARQTVPRNSVRGSPRSPGSLCFFARRRNIID